MQTMLGSRGIARGFPGVSVTPLAFTHYLNIKKLKLQVLESGIYHGTGHILNVKIIVSNIHDSHTYSIVLSYDFCEKIEIL